MRKKPEELEKIGKFEPADVSGWKNLLIKPVKKFLPVWKVL